jgi:hypothetical protein
LTMRNDRQDQNKEGAEAAFKKKQERLRDGEQAMVQYEADRLAVLEKTARLRALRLARDAAAHDEPTPARSPELTPAPKRPSARKLAPAARLKGSARKKRSA